MDATLGIQLTRKARLSQLMREPQPAAVGLPPRYNQVVLWLSMITKASLISVRNLELAWGRITTAKNLQHKRMFRHLYRAYEPGRRANLLLLHDRLMGGWEPTRPIRLYMPNHRGC